MKQVKKKNLKVTLNYKQGRTGQQTLVQIEDWNVGLKQNKKKLQMISIDRSQIK